MGREEGGKEREGDEVEVRRMRYLYIDWTVHVYIVDFGVDALG
jgi:hypothetical protein